MAGHPPVADRFEVPEGAGRILRVGAVLAGAGLLAHLLHGVFDIGGRSWDGFFANGLYNALIIAGALAVVARGVLVREERRSWIALGLGVLAWAAGEIIYTLKYGTATAPVPSLADPFYLAYYPGALYAVWRLARQRLASADRYLILDGLISSFAAAAVVSAAIFGAVWSTAGHKPEEVLTNLAYPVGDMLLLAAAIGVFSLTGWRPGRAWLVLGAGFVVGMVADSIYLYQQAVGTYHVGEVTDSLWPAAMLALAVAAWVRPPPQRERPVESMTMVAVPGVFALVALGVLVTSMFHRLNDLAVALAAASLLTVIARAALTLAENLRLLARARQEALHDVLTGLANRRMLLLDLEAMLAEATEEDPLVLVMFDLDGFKAYNDAFGHMAGDGLLARLGRNLDASITPFGRAYRIGGDEFCALIRPQPPGVDTIVGTAVAALTDRGEGFEIGSSHGIVFLPREASGMTAALRLADERMYHDKGERKAVLSPGREMLAAVLRERGAALSRHLQELAELSQRTGHRLGLSEEQQDELVRAAQLHDIGKAAIPDEILNKPATLSAEEWKLVRGHTIIGERILTTAPALAPVARIVRSSHERWDGAGYPDALAGEAIPIGARIISVGDAFLAMIADRSYGAGMSPDRALDELRRGAGTQFDPVVVEAFSAEVGMALGAPDRAPAPNGAALAATGGSSAGDVAAHEDQ